MPNIIKDLRRKFRRRRPQLASGQSEGKLPTARMTQPVTAEALTEPVPIHDDTNDVDSIAEDDSYGIKVLHNPASAYVDIVFVHGLTGNAHRTWFHKESRVLWPRDLLSLDLPNSRIMKFGYDADVFSFVGYAAQDNMSGYANGLLGGLAGQRKDLRVCL